MLYTGLTGELQQRIYQRREKLPPGFTSRCNVSKLVYYECTEDPSSAIAREKQIEAGSRRKKIDLVTGFNPQWCDLFDHRPKIPRLNTVRLSCPLANSLFPHGTRSEKNC